MTSTTTFQVIFTIGLDYKHYHGSVINEFATLELAEHVAKDLKKLGYTVKIIEKTHVVHSPV